MKFNQIIRKMPRWSRIVLGAIVGAIFFSIGYHAAGPVLAMAGLTANPSSRTLGGGNKLYFRQLTKAADGTFTVLGSGSDVLGATAGTWHILGSHTETPWARTSEGQYTLEPQLVENDIKRKTLLEKVAPYSSTAIKTKPELDLEDGTMLQNAANLTGDDTKPYFDFIYFEAPTPAGKEHVFFCVGQFDRATSFPFKTNEFNLFKVKISSVDANGYAVATLPSPDTRLTGVTAPTLSGGLAQGTTVEQS
jgi:hypothetical protein